MKTKVVTISLLAPILILGGILGPQTSTTVYAQKKIATDSKKPIQEDINTWMPNKYTQKALLEGLIDEEYLPEGSTIQDITKELLASIPPGYIHWSGAQIGQISLDLDASIDGVTTQDTFKGLEYITKGTIYANIKNFKENQFNTIDWKDFPSNGETKEGAKSELLFNVQNKDGRISAEMFHTLNAFANNPEGHYIPGTLAYSLIVTGEAVGELDLSNENYKHIVIKDTDFSTDPLTSLGNKDFSMYIYNKVTHLREFLDIYEFKHNDSLGQWEGTYNPTYESVWERIRNNPGIYSLNVQQADNDDKMFVIGTQTYDFK